MRGCVGNGAEMETMVKGTCRNNSESYESIEDGVATNVLVPNVAQHGFGKGLDSPEEEEGHHLVFWLHTNGRGSVSKRVPMDTRWYSLMKTTGQMDGCRGPSVTYRRFGRNTPPHPHHGRHRVDPSVSEGEDVVRWNKGPLNNHKHGSHPESMERGAHCDAQPKTAQHRQCERWVQHEVDVVRDRDPVHVLG